MSRRYVLDASAVLDFINDATGAERVEQLLNDARSDGTPLLLSTVNWGEVFYVSWERRGEERARSAMSRLSRLPIEVIPVDMAQAAKAAEIKALHKIAYADSIAASLAEIRHSVLVTSDRDFEKLGRRIQVLWISKP